MLAPLHRLNRGRFYYRLRVTTRNGSARGGSKRRRPQRRSCRPTNHFLTHYINGPRNAIRLSSNFEKQEFRSSEVMKIMFSQTKVSVLLAGITALLALQACRYGTTIASFPPARSPK